MTDIDTITQRVSEHIHDGYTEIASFNNGDIVWVAAYEQWLFVATDPETNNRYWRGPENNAAHFLNYISDEDIRSFYDDNLADFFDEEDADKEVSE
jgi:hypothetical protein